MGNSYSLPAVVAGDGHWCIVVSDNYPGVVQRSQQVPQAGALFHCHHMFPSTRPSPCDVCYTTENGSH